MKNRAGSYKKTLFTSSELELVNQQVFLQVKGLIELLNNKIISDQEFTTLYILAFLRSRHPKNYLQGKLKANEKFGKYLLEIIPKEFKLSEDEIIKLKNVTGLDLFESFNLRGIPQSINRAMINWYKNEWNIILTFKIPSVIELLQMQSNNSRALTLITNQNKMNTLILGNRDPLSFALHDLMHADQFFNNPESSKGQIGFYKLIYAQYDNLDLQQLINSNPTFKNEFEYVISDMNAYIIHLLKSFKSSFSKANSIELMNNLFILSKTPQYILEIIKKINVSDLILNEELTIKNYFESLID